MGGGRRDDCARQREDSVDEEFLCRSGSDTQDVRREVGRTTETRKGREGKNEREKRP